MPFDHPPAVRQPHLPGLVSATPAPSLAELLARIPSWVDLDETQRRDLESCLRTVARIIGQPPANIRCDIGFLNQRLFERPPAAYRLGESTFQSIISRLRFVLRRVGVHQPHQRGENLLGPAWRGFLQAIANEPLRAGLRGLARHCDCEGLSPQQIDDAAMARFLESDRQTRLSAATADQGPNLAAAWRKAVQVQADPSAFHRLTAPRRREPYTLDFSAYPASFQADIERFRSTVARIETGAEEPCGRLRITLSAARAPGTGPFTANTKGPARRLKPRSVETRLFSLRQAAAALVNTGTPREEITSLSSLVRPIENVERIITYFLDKADGAPGSQRQSIAEVLLQIARHHVVVPPEDLVQIREWKAEVTGPRMGEMGPKARTCLLQLRRPRVRHILTDLPETIVANALRDALTPIERARRVRAAVLIGILLRCPLRIGNLHALRLDQHLARLDGPKRPSHILIRANETKNDNGINFPIPPDLARLIQTFINEYRPLLAAAGNPYLFTGGEQGALSINQTRTIFKDFVEGATGVDVFPHIVRHLAALCFLEAHPGQYEVLRRILGHKDIQTTKGFYTGLETDAAFKLFEEAITSQRSELRKLAQASATPSTRQGKR